MRPILEVLHKTYRDAFHDSNWQNAMRDEYDALIKNSTWTLVPQPPDANVVRYMWLFRHKARLVANGSTQLEGVDVDETFSPLVKPKTIRTVLSLAVFRHWPIHQLDVKNAFLHEGLTETVYMHQPPGFRDSTHPDYVCLLQRSLYGLKQAPRAWFQRFSSYITHAGCPTTRRSTSGYCVFLGNNLLSWSSKRQPTLFRSSAEAECGVANAVAETCWLRNLLRELHTPLSFATLVYCDNVSVVYLSSNPVQHQRTKHIEIDIHFLRDLVAVGKVRVLHVSSRYQFADIFTKGLPSALFEEFRSNLSIRCPPAPTTGGC
uniref:Ribonuclease H-like domain-containing protein n=1 Tax=Tanacetum cinerariifolium TaxID=118510 RepID=A0A6L2NF99_TANCI|nr:ribonuclease H-like domain-containing protein [Tanacetum cinerariifolium]